MNDQLELRVNIVRLQFQRLVKILDALLSGCGLLRKIQIVIGGFRSSVFIDRMDALLRQELLCQTIHAVFICRLIPMLHQEILKLFQKLFCISAHFYLPYLLRGLLIVWFSCMKLYQIRQPSSRDKRHLIIRFYPEISKTCLLSISRQGKEKRSFYDRAFLCPVL